jgi:ABC-type dipeptide/oligopeptide/nickel transport system permease component
MFILKRLAIAIPTLLVLIIMSFILMKIAPGNPFTGEKKLPRDVLINIYARYGLDKPDWQQLIDYVWNIVVHFDFGPSFKYKDRTVNDIIAQGFPVSAQLGVQALLLSLAIALPLGVVSALKQNTVVDYGSLFFATVGYTIPSFVIAIFAIYIFAVNLRMLPIIGWGDIRHMILPTVILALGPAAVLTRITRASMLEAIRQDYVRTARSKGLREQVVIVTHVMKNAMIPVATIVGPVTAGLITGSFIIEQLFSVPGVGRLYVTSILGRDYPVIMATTLLYAFLIMVANITVDIVYGILDPRIKVGK